MNKVVVTAVVVVGLTACVAAASVWSGSAVTGRLARQSQDLHKLFPTIEVVKEERSTGLLSSTYDVTYRLGCLPAGAGGALGVPAGSAPVPIEVGFHHDIKHGPVPGGSGLGLATVDSRLVLPPAWRARVDKVIGKQELLKVHTAIDLAGNYDSTFQLPELNIEQPGQGKLTVNAIHGSVHGKGGSGAGMLPFASELPSVTLTAQTLGQNLVFKMTGLKSAGEISHDPESIYWFGAGKTHGSLDAMSLTGALPSLDGGPPRPLSAVLTNLTFGSTNTLDKGLWSTTSQLTGKGRINQTSIDKLEMRVSMKRIEAVAYQRLVQTLLGSALSCDPAARASAPDVLLAATSKQAALLLKHDPEHALEQLAVELDGRRLELSYSVGSKGVTDADLATASPAALADKAVVRGAARVHIGLIDQAITSVSGALPASDPALAAQGGLAGAAGALPSLELVHATIDQFVQMGFLTREADYVSVAVSMVGGQFLINGKPMQLPTFGLPTGP